MVSVIVPSYNHQNYLKQRIDSILAQTYQDFELIILDDKSPDNSKAVIEQYRENPKMSHIIYNEQNSGSVFKQWKKGVDLAKGDYIWIAESDDFAEPKFLERMVPILDAKVNLSFVYCNAHMVDTHGQLLNKTLSDHRNNSVNELTWNYTFEATGEDFLSKYLSKECWVNNASAVLFRADRLRNLSINLNEYKFAGDWAVYVDLLFNGDVYYLNECLSYYREHTLNASNRAFENNQITVEIFSILSRYYEHLKLMNFDAKRYVFDVRMHIVPTFILSKSRKIFYAKLEKINNELARKFLRLLPVTFLQLAVKRIKRKL